MIRITIARFLATAVLLAELAGVNQITQFQEPVRPSSVSIADTFPRGKAGEWEPDPADVALISRTIWGETRGCCEEEQRAQAWCILNRVDDPRWPDSIEAVVTAPYQFQGYSASNPVEPFEEMAKDILAMWHEGEREIPADMCFCAGDGRHQTFRNEWERTENTRYWP